MGLGTLFGLDRLCVQVESKVGSMYFRSGEHCKQRSDERCSRGAGVAGRLAGPGHGNRACSRTSLEK